MEEIKLIEIILLWLKDIGLLGLFVAMFLEGASFPFPGIVVVLSYGYILPFSYLNTIWVAASMSVIYSLASLIPYFIGRKIEGIFQKRPNKGLTKAMSLFIRFGGWSVAISRPFGIGNYISYVAGMSKMRLIPYLLLTFIGIYPWSYVMLLLGSYFEGNYQAFISFYKNNSVYVYTIVTLILGIILLYVYKKYKRIHSRELKGKG
jgi:membrane protein DedA with SNARE-associated domain